MLPGLAHARAGSICRMIFLKALPERAPVGKFWSDAQLSVAASPDDKNNFGGRADGRLTISFFGRRVTVVP